VIEVRNYLLKYFLILLMLPTKKRKRHETEAEAPPARPPPTKRRKMDNWQLSQYFEAEIEKKHQNRVPVEEDKP